MVAWSHVRVSMAVLAALCATGHARLTLEFTPKGEEVQGDQLPAEEVPAESTPVRFWMKELLGGSPGRAVHRALRLDEAGQPVGPSVALKVFLDKDAWQDELDTMMDTQRGGACRAHVIAPIALPGPAIAVRCKEGVEADCDAPTHVATKLAIAMPLMKGTLQDWFDSKPGMPVLLRCRTHVMRQIRMGVDCLHQQGLVHTNLHAKNVMYNAYTNDCPDDIVVIGFGWSELNREVIDKLPFTEEDFYERSPTTDVALFGEGTVVVHPRMDANGASYIEMCQFWATCELWGPKYRLYVQ